LFFPPKEKLPTNDLRIATSPKNTIGAFKAGFRTAHLARNVNKSPSPHSLHVSTATSNFSSWCCTSSFNYCAILPLQSVISCSDKDLGRQRSSSKEG